MASREQKPNIFEFQGMIKGENDLFVYGIHEPDWLEKLNGTSYADIYNWLAFNNIPFNQEVVKDRQPRQFAMDRKIIVSEIYHKPLEERFGPPASDKKHGTCYNALFKVTRFPTLPLTEQSKLIYTLGELHQHTYVDYLTIEQWAKHRQKRDSKK